MLNNKNIDGFIGSNFFDKVPFLFNFKNNTFTMFATIEDFNNEKLLSKSYTQIPLSKNEFRFLLPIRFCKKCSDMDIILDTGSPFTFISQENAAKHLKNQKSKKIMVYIVCKIFL